MRKLPMREIVAGLLLVLPAGAGESLAQSITFIPAAPPSSSSIVSLGTGEPAVEAHAVSGAGAAEVFAVSTSVIAYGAEAIAPARTEIVSAVPDAAQPEAEPAWRAEAMPLIIRGGVVGDAFSASPAPEVALPEPEAASAPPAAPVEASRPDLPSTRSPL